MPQLLKRLSVLSILLIFFVTGLMAGGNQEGSSRPEDEVSEEMSSDLPVPKDKYVIAFSNGEMSNAWRWAFVDSMNEWANEFRGIGSGIDFRWTNADADSAKQLMDCDSLLSQNPDVLILSPYQDEPLDPVIDMAAEAGVPLITIDRALVRQPGNGTYVTAITQNFAFSGMYQAIYALEWLKDKYGEYKGNIVEIQGQIGASPTTDQYVGARAVLKHFPDVKIIATGEGRYSQSGGREVMEQFLERFPEGEIDLIFCHNDAEGLGAIEAIEAAGRTELLDGRILGKDQMVEFVKEIQAGRALMTTECSPYYGAFTLPLAIEYLNGDSDPEKVTYLPLRCWENPNDNIDLTPADNDTEINARHISYAEDAGLALIPPATGDWEGLTIDLTTTPGYDEVMEYSLDRSNWPKGISDLQNQ